ncbi:MAG: glycosyltransferase family 39 protein [Candidatus Saccharimonadaceae bacterium]|nr:glycosyltransferase family 39 protein [Candidatus Saccharimonadaceae bacterium]
MFKFDISEFYSYRFRYIIGYFLFVIGLISVLIFVGLYLPGGLSNQEMQSVIRSDSINHNSIWSTNVINLPYHLLQKVSLALFGVSILSIKLPSIILAFLSAIGMLIILRKWFKPRIGVLASLIAITTGQFLFIAQNGTPEVLYLFWPICLIFIASHLPCPPKYKYICSVLLFSTIALSLYTPLSVYILLAIIGATLFHPHLRYLFKQLSRPKLIFGSVFFLIIITPLIISVIMKPSLLLTLLGIPDHWPNLSANIKSLGIQYLGFTNPNNTTLMTPFFELGSMLIIAIGIFNTIRTIETAKSYILAFWTVCLLPVILFNPDFTSITFLPLVILLASGLSYLLSYWYDLFPRNPYARVGGLIPLVILVSVLIFSGIDRYIHGYRYDPNLSSSFSNDLKLIPKDTKELVVSSDESSFYSVYTRHRTGIILSESPTGDEFLASRKAKKNYAGYSIKRIITTSSINDADRFYLYKKIAN